MNKVQLLAAIASLMVVACGGLSTEGKKCSSDADCTGTFEKCSAAHVCRAVCTSDKPGSCPSGFKCVGSGPFVNGLCEPGANQDMAVQVNQACIDAILWYVSREASIQYQLADQLSSSDRMLFNQAVECGINQVCVSGQHFECNRKSNKVDFADGYQCELCLKGADAHSICSAYRACLPSF